MYSVLKLAGLSLLSMSFISNPLHAAEKQLDLAPSSKWIIDYSKDSCTLSRTFGKADKELSLNITRFYPADQFDLVIVGNHFKKTTSRKPVTIKFGPLLEEQKLKFKIGFAASNKNKEVAAIIISDTMRIAPYAQQEIKNNSSMITHDDEGAIQYISIKAFRVNEIILNTNSMSKAFAELRNCTNSLLESWGYDPIKQRSLTRAPTPINSPSNWIVPTDYPLQQLQNNEIASIQFRLDVNEKGETTKCFIQRSIGGEAFNKSVCSALMRRAKFKPALDKYGQPIAAYWVNKVLFDIP